MYGQPYPDLLGAELAAVEACQSLVQAIEQLGEKHGPWHVGVDREDVPVAGAVLVVLFAPRTRPRKERGAPASRDSRPLSELDRRLIGAFDRLVGGRSEIIDGALTVTNLCAEARVSRASYYRSPVAALVKTLLASDQTPRPEVEQLRQRVRELDKAGKGSGGGTPRRCETSRPPRRSMPTRSWPCATPNWRPTTAAWSRNWRRWKRQ